MKDTIMKINDKLGNELSVGDIVVDDAFRVGKIISFSSDWSQRFYWVNMAGGPDLVFRPYAPSFSVAKLAALNEEAQQV